MTHYKYLLQFSELQRCDWIFGASFLPNRRSSPRILLRRTVRVGDIYYFKCCDCGLADLHSRGTSQCAFAAPPIRPWSTKESNEATIARLHAPAYICVYPSDQYRSWRRHYVWNICQRKCIPIQRSIRSQEWDTQTVTARNGLEWAKVCCACVRVMSEPLMRHCSSPKLLQLMRILTRK
jgi:hypothetical protein